MLGLALAIANIALRLIRPIAPPAPAASWVDAAAWDDTATWSDTE